jgi:surface antigen
MFSAQLRISILPRLLSESEIVRTDEGCRCGSGSIVRAPPLAAHCLKMLSGENHMSNGLFGGRLLPATAIAVICSALLACAAEMGEKEEAGQEIGSIIGGIVGSYIPGNSIGAKILQNHGDLIGGMIGSAIGASLDEEDRKMLAQTTEAAFTTGKTQTFANRNTGVRGSARVTANRTNSDGRPCRTVKQEVKLKDGRTATDDVNACKGPDGGWKS